MKLIPIYNSDMARDYSLSTAVIYWLLWQSCNFWTNNMMVSFKQIGEFTWLSRRTAIRDIQKLENAWLIRVSRMKVWEENSRNVYEVVDIRKYPCPLNDYYN